MEKNALTIERKIISTERTNRSTGQTFIGHQLVKDNGDLIQCRFTKNCPQSLIPTTPGKRIITLIKGKFNISNKKEYPILWVDDIESIAEFEVKREESEIEI